ncbi:hypothetical protein VAMP_141n3, partial [Candidatus Vampirococcus lugosii]|nr:hypothetical protein [Candidatus Vampirococcus lugosii]
MNNIKLTDLKSNSVDDYVFEDELQEDSIEDELQEDSIEDELQ